MSALVFVDSNILVYAYDVCEPVRQERARETVRQCWRQANGCLSSQVLQEFYVTVTRKIKYPLTLTEAREVIGLYSNWQTITMGAKEIMTASRLQERYQLSFWDALILCAADVAGAKWLYSEDFQHGREIHGIRIVNPLR